VVGSEKGRAKRLPKSPIALAAPSTGKDGCKIERAGLRAEGGRGRLDEGERRPRASSRGGRPARGKGFERHGSIKGATAVPFIERQRLGAGGPLHARPQRPCWLGVRYGKAMQSSSIAGRPRSEPQSWHRKGVVA